MPQLPFPVLFHRRKQLFKFKQIKSIQNQDSLSDNNQELTTKGIHFSEPSRCLPSFKPPQRQNIGCKTVVEPEKCSLPEYNKTNQLNHYRIQPPSMLKDKNKLKRRISTAGNHSRLPPDFFCFEGRHCSSTKNALSNGLKITGNLVQDHTKNKGWNNRTKSMASRQTIITALLENDQIQNQMTPKFHDLKKNSPSKYEEQNQFLIQDQSGSFIVNSNFKKKNDIEIQKFSLQTSECCLKQITNCRGSQCLESHKQKYLLKPKVMNLSGLKRLRKSEQLGRIKKIQSRFSSDDKSDIIQPSKLLSKQEKKNNQFKYI